MNLRCAVLPVVFLISLHFVGMDTVDTIYKREKDAGAGSGSVSSANSKRDSDVTAAAAPAEDYSFPKTLAEFGFYFAADGQLLEIGTDKRFCFSVSEDKKYNQKRYEALGNIMTEHIYQLLSSRCHLQEMLLPADGEDAMEPYEAEQQLIHHNNVPLNLSPRAGGAALAGGTASSASTAAPAPGAASFAPPRTRIFLSPGALTTCEVLLVIVQGSGSVRAGVWSRRLLINEGIMIGSQLSLIEAAQERGWGVVVLNPNLNYVYQPDNTNGIGGKKIHIKGHASAEQHFENVWRHLLRPSKARWLLVVGHSYGGVALTHQLQPFKPRSETHRAAGRQEWLRRRAALLQDILGAAADPAKPSFIKEPGRLAALALTDSPASLLLQGIVEPPELVEWFQQNAVNWVSSDLAMDALISEPEFIGRRDIPKRSAGTTEHERTAVLPQDSLLLFLDQRLQAAKNALRQAQASGSPALAMNGAEAMQTNATQEQHGTEGRRKRPNSEEL